MSDSKFDKDKQQKLLDSREKSKVEPVAKQQDFFEWFERLFEGETNFPEKIEIRAVSGKNYERLGPMIKQIIFPPKPPRPSREEMVRQTNELIFLMQRDCDIQRKSVVYGVHVAHFARDTDFYERWLERRYPSAVRAGEGIPRQHVGGEDEDGEGLASHERFAALVLQHHERLFALYGGGFEGLLDRMDRVLERQDSRIAKQDDRIEKLTDVVERAMSLEEDRREKREWNKLKRESLDKAVGLALSLAPPIIGGIAGKSLPAGSLEVITLRNFFKKKAEGGQLTEEQAVAAFGADDGTPGILRIEQTKLLLDVAYGKVSPDELDKFITPGGLQITPDQAIALQTRCGFTPEQLAPLYLILESRMRRMQEQTKN